MNTLQEHLNQLKNKDQITEINLQKIQSEREQSGSTELLTGGELDLREFTNLEKIEIDPQFLTTPLTKLNLDGLIHLKELDWLETKPESEEDKKLFEELGISQDINKKKVVKEVQRLAELKGVKINFGEVKEGEISLSLGQKDKQGNFCPSLVFWTLAQELAISAIGGDKTAKTPEFWKKFKEELEWVRDNLIVLPIEQGKPDFRRDFTFLLNPSTFPTDQLEIKEFLIAYYPNSEEIAVGQDKEITISLKIVDKTWQTIKEKVLELTDQALKNSPDEEKLPTLAFNLRVDYNSDKYSILLAYHSKSPFIKELQELFNTVPLQLENELLKKEKEQLPTPENFEEVVRQMKEWQEYVQELTDEAKYQEIKQKIEKKD